jgi:hypothetical protein
MRKPPSVSCVSLSSPIKLTGHLTLVYEHSSTVHHSHDYRIVLIDPLNFQNQSRSSRSLHVSQAVSSGLELCYARG